jgi:cysteine desulfurase
MIYLDYAATTPVDRAVLEQMMPFFTEKFGNAASPHWRGREAAAHLELAREKVAGLLGCRPGRLVFTSGATESLNTAIKAVAGTRPGEQIVVGATEHKAALEAAEAAAGLNGSRLAVAPVTPAGTIDLNELANIVARQPTAAIVAMAANNETGVLNPIPEVTQVARESGAFSIVDVTQQAGRLPVAIDDWGVDFAAASAHKIYGPQGVGALVVPQQWPSGGQPLLHGGDHERGWRSGTTNLAGAVGFGAAAELALPHLGDSALRNLGDRLATGISARIRATSVHGQGAKRLPGFVNIHLPHVDADALLVNTPGVLFATGSACTSSTPSPSHVLVAMGVSRDAADESIRLTAGRYTTEDEIDVAVEMLVASAERLAVLQGAEA